VWINGTRDLQTLPDGQDLQDSHFLGKIVYQKLSRTVAEEPNPRNDHERYRETITNSDS
jgi:hypothetical protein